MSGSITGVKVLVGLLAATCLVALILKGRAVVGRNTLAATLEWREAGDSDLF